MPARAGERQVADAVDLRMDGEITAEEYLLKRHELHERQRAIAFAWVTADYNEKRTILGIILKNVRLNCGNFEFTPRDSFHLLQDKKIVPPSGASGTPVELFLAGTAELDSGTVSSLAAVHRAR